MSLQDTTRSKPLDLAHRLRRPVLSTDMPRYSRPANLDVAPVNHSLVAGLALVTVDVAVLGLAASLPLVMALLLPQFISPFMVAVAVGCLLPVLVVNAFSGLYPGFGLMLAERLRLRWLRGFAYVAGICAALLALGEGQQAVLVAMTGIIALLAAPLAEDLTRLALHRLRRWGKPALILAGARQAVVVRATLQQNWAVGLLPVMLAEPITRSPTTMVIPAGTKVTPEYGHVAEAYRVAEGGIVTRMYVRPAPQVAASPLRHKLHLAIKRGLDIAVGSAAVLLSLPLVAIAAVFVYARDPGPVFYKQERRGKQGKPIQIWKLRSMYLDSAARLEKLLAEDRYVAAEWAERHKLTSDPRILPGVGHFIRRYSVDELPQLFSVVTGQLSLVGPRVFVDYDLAVYPPEALALRQSVTPGLTGLWQVTVRNDGDNIEKVRYDSAYVKNWSIWSDLELLYRTVGVVVGGRGAY